jgi:hypothetical protein
VPGGLSCGSSGDPGPGAADVCHWQHHDLQIDVHELVSSPIDPLSQRFTQASTVPPVLFPISTLAPLIVKVQIRTG